MSTQNPNATASNLPEWLDPFPEPQTIPGGWNLDSLVQAPAAQAAEEPREARDPQDTHHGSSLIFHA